MMAPIIIYTWYVSVCVRRRHIAVIYVSVSLPITSVRRAVIPLLLTWVPLLYSFLV